MIALPCKACGDDIETREPAFYAPAARQALAEIERRFSTYDVWATTYNDGHKWHGIAWLYWIMPDDAELDLAIYGEPQRTQQQAVVSVLRGALNELTSNPDELAGLMESEGLPSARLIKVGVRPGKGE